jgi:CheY-like chemotaxis protein
MKRRDDKQGSLFWFAIPYRPDKQYADHMKNKKQDGVENTIAMHGHEECEPEFGTRKEVTGAMADAPTVRINQLIEILNKNPKGLESRENTATIVVSEGEGLLGQQKGKYSILLVDDSPTIVKMSSMMLKRLGHSVTTAENGAIAVKLVEESLAQQSVPSTSEDLEENERTVVGDYFQKEKIIPPIKPFDIILIDLQMPVMDGYEATKRIRMLESNAYHARKKSNSRHSKLLIIGMSANSDYEISDAIVRAGADGFLSKPFNLAAINALFATFSS